MDLFLILHLHLSECVVFFLPQTLYYNNNIDHIQFSRRAIVTISSRVNLTLSYSFSDYLVSFYDQFVLIKIVLVKQKTVHFISKQMLIFPQHVLPHNQFFLKFKKSFVASPNANAIVHLYTPECQGCFRSFLMSVHSQQFMQK